MGKEPAASRSRSGAGNGDLAADAVIIGGGHNGLVHACYLAKAESY